MGGDVVGTEGFVVITTLAVVVGVTLVVGACVGTSQLGLFAPFVQQYFPRPPFSQQSLFEAPFMQQKGPKPPLIH